MKNKIITPINFLLVIIRLTNCSKDYKAKITRINEPKISPCSELKIPTCNDTLPKEECDSPFKMWFYMKDKNKCEQIIYNGCSNKGFETQKECEECICN